MLRFSGAHSLRQVFLCIRVCFCICIGIRMSVAKDQYTDGNDVSPPQGTPRVTTQMMNIQVDYSLDLHKNSNSNWIGHQIVPASYFSSQERLGNAVCS